MSYDFNKWKKRISNRSDMSMFLTHLTRTLYNNDGTVHTNGIDILLKILSEKKLLGSTTETGFIKGSERAVCFQDVPMYSLTQNVLHEELYKEELGGKLRYQAYGLSFYKNVIFNRGGRPVIYEKTDIAKEKFKDELWRVVSFDLSNKNKIIDWTHEREWRVKGDFEFNLDELFVILPNNKSYKMFISNADKNILQEIAGIIVATPIIF